MGTRPLRQFRARLCGLLQLDTAERAADTLTERNFDVARKRTLLLKRLDFATSRVMGRILVEHFVARAEVIVRYLRVPISRSHKGELLSEQEDGVLRTWLEGIELASSPDHAL